MPSPFLFSAMTADDDARLDPLISEVVPELSWKAEPDPKVPSIWSSAKQVPRFWLDHMIEEDSRIKTDVVLLGIVFFSVFFHGLIYPDAPSFWSILVFGFVGSWLSFLAGILIMLASWPITIFIDFFLKTEGKKEDRLVETVFVLLVTAFTLACSIYARKQATEFHGLLVTFSWVAPFLYRLRIIHKKAKSDHEFFSRHVTKPPTIPTVEVVKKRFLDKTRDEIKRAKEDLEGPDSRVERRIAELKLKLRRANAIARHFNQRRKANPEDSLLAERHREAQETIKLFKADLQAIQTEQAATLDLFREIEEFIPIEENRLKDDELTAELHALRGEASVSRVVSRDIILDAIRPVTVRLIPVEQARAKLLLYLSARADEPGSIARLEAEAGRIGTEFVEAEKRIEVLNIA